MRCDGLVEYAYEYSGFPVWGKKLVKKPTHFDICIFPYEHNNLYEGIWPNNPNVELAPVVQCGKKGGTSTCMVNPAVIDYPTINVYVTPTSGPSHVRIRAADQSGIHKIEYKWSVNGIVTYVPPPPNPQGFQEVSTTAASNFIYIRVYDGAGNSDGWHIYPIN